MKRSIAVLAVIAAMAFGGVAMADHGHGGPGGPGPGDFGGEHGGGAVVGSDGTLYLTSTIFDSSTNTATTTLKAISPAGSVKWTITLTSGERLRLSGSNLLSVSYDSAAVKSTINAIAAATGAAAWSQTIPGRVEDLVPFNGGTYAVVVTPAATTGGTATRSLVAISDAGAVLWTISV
jgi:hypothetical protein